MNNHLSRFFGILFLLAEIAVLPIAAELMVRQHLSDLSTVSIVTLAMTFGSIALCIVMSFSSMSEHERFPLHTFLFELMVFMCFIAPLTDLLSRVTDGNGNPGENLLINTVFYLVGINVTFVIMLYEFLIVGAKKKPKLKKMRSFAAALMVLDNIATLLNARFGYFFTIDQAGAYHPAPTFLLAYIPPAVIIAMTAYVAAKEMRPGNARRAFLLFWVFGIFTSLLQILRPELSVQYTGYTLSLVVIYIYIQSELISGIADAITENKAEENQYAS